MCPAHDRWLTKELPWRVWGSLLTQVHDRRRLYTTPIYREPLPTNKQAQKLGNMPTNKPHIGRNKQTWNKNKQVRDFKIDKYAVSDDNRPFQQCQNWMCGTRIACSSRENPWDSFVFVPVLVSVLTFEDSGRMLHLAREVARMAAYHKFKVAGLENPLLAHAKHKNTKVQLYKYNYYKTGPENPLVCWHL